MIIESFNIIGISVRTTNENNKAMQDIGQLWGRFMSEDVHAKIPNKADDTIYSVYTEYEKDYTGPYTTILGCRVSSLENIPDGMVSVGIGGGAYKQYITKGNLMQGIVGQQWMKIWNDTIDRRYTSDFEVYGEKASNPQDAEVEIYVAIK
jgi:predicted transcriptional regulator YdeE